MTLPRLAVVVVHFGPEALCRACLESLRQSIGVSVALWLVDHNPRASALLGDLVQALDGSYLHRPANPGFAAGVNLGLAAAQRQGTWDLLVALNPDVELEPECLRELVLGMRGDERIAIVGPALEFPGEPKRWWNVGSRIDWPQARPRSLRHGEPAAPLSPCLLEVDFVAGCVLGIAPLAFEQLGGLDEHYFLYFEDADYAYRARSHGWRVVVCPGAIARHSGGGSSGEQGESQASWRARSRRRFSKRWNPYPLRGAIQRLVFAARQALKSACWWPGG